MPKSGSTLAFRLTQAILTGAGRAQPPAPPGVIGGAGGHYLDHLGAEVLMALRDWVSGRGLAPLALKTHAAPTPAVLAGIERGWIAAQAVARDPRDMALSMRDAGAQGLDWGATADGPVKTPEQAIPRITRMIRRHDQWARLPGTLLLGYEPLAFDMAATAVRIARHLDVVADLDAAVAEAKAAATQLNRGQPQRHRAEMTPAQSADWAARFGPFIQQRCPTVPDRPGA